MKCRIMLDEGEMVKIRFPDDTVISVRRKALELSPVIRGALLMPAPSGKSSKTDGLPVEEDSGPMGLLLSILEYQVSGVRIADDRIKADNVKELDDAVRLADKYDVATLYESGMLLHGFEWLPTFNRAEQVFRIAVTLGHKGLLMASLPTSGFAHPALWHPSVMRGIGWPLGGAIIQSAVASGWENVTDTGSWMAMQQIFNTTYYDDSLIGPNRLRQ